MLFDVLKFCTVVRKFTGYMLCISIIFWWIRSGSSLWFDSLCVKTGSGSVFTGKSDPDPRLDFHNSAIVFIMLVINRIRLRIKTYVANVLDFLNIHFRQQVKKFDHAVVLVERGTWTKLIVEPRFIWDCFEQGLIFPIFKKRG